MIVSPIHPLSHFTVYPVFEQKDCDLTHIHYNNLMKTLVIAEKPDMGRNIAAVIEPKAVNKRSYLEGERYIVTWAIGHLITLAEPDTYHEKYKRWNIHDLPILPETFQLIPYPKTIHQLKLIADLAKRCDQLVNACDAGREGQYIFYLIQHYLHLQQPVKRLWISDLTPETIRNGFLQLRDAENFAHLTKAAKARSEADWIIGMNASRAFTTKHRILLSVGRVQTPVLALIYDRQLEMEAFDSQTYYEVVAHFAQEDTVYKGIWQGERLTDKTKADLIAAETTGQMGRTSQYECKDTKEYAHKLYDLTALQREANAKLAFSAKKTLDLAQSLYEKHKLITYPRTNSNYVTEQNIHDMHRALEALRHTQYQQLVEGANKALVNKNNRFICNPAKVEDHHAILPTAKRAQTLTPDERNLYDLIIKRFISQFYPPAEYKIHTIMTTVLSNDFKTVIKEQTHVGWKIIYADGQDQQEQEEECTDRPFQLDSTKPVQNLQTEVKEKQTQPPKSYTEGTLLRAMESAGKQLENEELREVMKDAGLGTPATRAATIERLKQVEYIMMQGKRIVITNKGRTAVELIRQAGIQLLTSPEMTGMWERRLHEISRGIAEEQPFMKKVKEFATYIVEQVRNQASAAKSSFARESNVTSKPNKPLRKKRAVSSK
jgi:DNA topoisomerase-3